MGSEPDGTLGRDGGECKPIRWSAAALAARMAPPVRIVTLLGPAAVCRALQREDGRIVFACWPRGEWDAAHVGDGWLGLPEIAGDDLATASPHELSAPFAGALARFIATLAGAS